MTETPPDPSRRKLLVRASLAIGGAIGAGVAYPLVRYLLFPLGRRVVKSPEAPVDVLRADALAVGAPPVRVEITAEETRDAWGTVRDVPLGAAWVRKTDTGELQAFSTVCPHLGCAVDFDASEGVFKCPCHRSAFAVDGDKLSGPAKRGLDPLPVAIEDGTVKVTYLRFRPDVADREKA